MTQQIGAYVKPRLHLRRDNACRYTPQPCNIRALASL